MKNILIAGGTGLVGLHLSRLLKSKGYNVSHLSRQQNKNAEFPAFKWDIEKESIDESAFLSSDYIINLAGSGIADKRWTDERKKDIIQSRTKSTLLLKKYLSNTSHSIKAYISASAIGYYGERGDELVTEESPQGQGFLAESTFAWENAIEEVRKTGIRTVGLRIGIVLSTEGGALEKMLIPFSLRTGIYFGNGEQWYSWIHIDDICNMFVWAIETETAKGYYNAVSPNPLSNYVLTQAISEAKGGGYLLAPAPSFGLRLAMGEMADVVLNSTKVSSWKIVNEGFKFQYPEAVMALKDLFVRKV
jgi:uncharacterized protein